MKKGDYVETPLGHVAQVLVPGPKTALVRYLDGPLKGREARFERKNLRPALTPPGG